MIFRVAWEQRVRKRCECCTDDSPQHQWVFRVEGPFDTPEDARKAEGKLFDDEWYEVRNVRTDYSESPVWREYNEWEHEHAAEHKARLAHIRETQK